MLKILLVLLILIALIIAIFKLLKGELKKYRLFAFLAIVVAGFSIHEYSIRKNPAYPAYDDSRQIISQNHDVLERLGSPIDSGSRMQGTYGQDHASYRYSVRGPKGEGTVYVRAKVIGDKWEYDDFRVVIGDSTIYLNKLPNKSQERTE